MLVTLAIRTNVLGLVPMCVDSDSYMDSASICHDVVSHRLTDTNQGSGSAGEHVLSRSKRSVAFRHHVKIKKKSLSKITL